MTAAMRHRRRREGCYRVSVTTTIAGVAGPSITAAIEAVTDGPATSRPKGIYDDDDGSRRGSGRFGSAILGVCHSGNLTLTLTL